MHLSWTADNIKRNEIEKKKNVTEIWVALNNITSGTWEFTKNWPTEKDIYIYINILTEKMGEKNLKKNWFKNQNHPDSISEN